MKEIHGDLIKLGKAGKFDVIIHGCNCQNAMGAGIALQIKNQIPEAYRADLATEKGDRDKLGDYSSATVDINGHKLTVVNAYTKYHYHGRVVLAEYDAIKAVFEKIAQDFTGKRIGYPLIGAGLAGGDWDIISGIIEEALAGEDHTLVKIIRWCGKHPCRS